MHGVCGRECGDEAPHFYKSEPHCIAERLGAEGNEEMMKTAEQRRMYCARRAGKAIDRVIVLMPGEEKERARKWVRVWVREVSS